MIKLLLVEDDPQVRSMLSETLRQEGYEVVEAANGREAIAAYKASPADLVITDIIMPEQDGVETIHSLRRDFPQAKIIAISGGSANVRGEYLLGTADALGAMKTFKKPVDINLLLKTIADLLGAKT
ncbi:response regulator [Megalodesulfovibrio gigas]|uniref:Putative response regulator with CheY-like receiver, AAA-type ATPase n=1 Tax=Megalodesulfovibrio gigas (strain ATCC 19364 / DSM 1382 / NCIMB 9332 / VKM B-1759) TaxID=1121448 RepID=T2GDY8_MEGG1|nr:response regulator [Megalodesulfovibrio gigas]AGW14394.1 putative response regulator with CheY-like receiver, AAA-type ATPase [Megalodesulfovibrio gigas DSM 1382 = ATCC 19364]